MVERTGTAVAAQRWAEYGDRLRGKRKEIGLTREALAEQTGIPYNWLWMVEHGRRNVSARLDRLELICEVLGCKPSWVLGIE